MAPTLYTHIRIMCRQCYTKKVPEQIRVFNECSRRAIEGFQATKGKGTRRLSKLSSGNKEMWQKGSYDKDKH